MSLQKTNYFYQKSKNMIFKISTAMLILFTLTGVAQTKTYKIEEDFNRIKITNKINAEIIPGAKETKVIVEGYGSEDLKWNVKQGELKLSLPLDELFSESDTKVKLYVNSFMALTLNNGAEVEVTEKLTQKHLEIDLSEASFLSAELDVKDLRVKSVTGATVQLSGETKHYYCTVKTGGIANTKHLISSNADVKVSYGGSIRANATKSIRAAVTAGGTIYIYGKPSKINQKTKLGGEIKRMSKLD